MSGVAGRKALVKVTGDAVAFVDEATSTTDDTIYQITNASKRVWDRTVTIVVEDGGVAVDPEVDPYVVDRLNGTITFETDDDTRVITVSGSYLPLSTAAGAKAFSFSLACSAIDDTDFESADTDDGFMSYLYGMYSISGSIGKRWRVDQYFVDALLAGIPVVIVLYADASVAPILKVWATLSKVDTQAVLDGAIDGTIEFVGAADADGRVASAA